MTGKKNHFIYMLVALLLFLVVMPIVEDHALLSDDIVRLVAFSCLMLVGVFSLRESSGTFRLGLVLAAIGVSLNVLGYSSVEGNFVPGSMITLCLFLALAIWASLKRVLFTDDLSFDRVIGTICVYLLLGTIWAVMYGLADLSTPGSFHGIEIADQSGWDTRWIYFSFITLTTLGYGDITPATNTTRVLVYAEAIFGVFYMAILVAGLVSGYLAESQKNR